MVDKLVIVESPAKAKSIGKILGRSYSIKASVGHVRDLPQWGLGVDVKNGFAPRYEVPKAKKKVVKELKEAARKAKSVYLATDPDREGEAIAWHLVAAAELDGVEKHRVVFHEITEQAIKNAFRHSRQIDMHLVDAQQARRVLDRLVGYKVSPLLGSKVRRGLSAGRVQSVALRMIVEREREIQSFVPQEYWTIEAELSKFTDAKPPSFRAKLAGIKDKGEKLKLNSEEDAKPVVQQLRKATYLVTQVKKKRLSRQPAPPFITSTLQQEAWRKLHFTADRTMSVAQQLYEGLPLGPEGQVGLITYMRTDSTRVADSAMQETRQYVAEKYGAEFLPSKPRLFTRKAKGAQEAHEAIRPTKADREPDSVKPYLSAEQAKLYRLIWERMIASQMAAAVFDTTAVDIEAKQPQESKVYILKATGSILHFPGFLVLYSEGKDEAEGEEEAGAGLPPLDEGERLRLLDVLPEQHFTQPPPRFNEATLVKALEERGIGRPSTYAPIISTLRRRDYVERKRDGRFYPLEMGFVVNDLLVQHFPNIVDTGFTAKLEEQLDEIARGERGWVGAISEFYVPFEETLRQASVNMVKMKQPDEPTDEVCPECGRPMVIRTGRFGKFLACSGFPKCKTTKSLKAKAEVVSE
ncbi:MAG: type I DNA topoisomerase [Chloroflexi bacterium]|nr:type I DNA topoisomerase [Chloroflexota bacterium]